MKVKVLREAGFEESALGFSLSYNSTPERAKEILYKYAFKNNGENKFLRCIELWIDVDFPRLLWPEADQYKIATTTLSESTIHTLGKRLLNQEDFIIPIDTKMLDIINEKILDFQNKKINILKMKSHLPEGFLQRRIWHMNYANLQNIYLQRKNHKLSLWHEFLGTVLSQIQHPEFIVPPEKSETESQKDTIEKTIRLSQQCAKELGIPREQLTTDIFIEWWMHFNK